MLDYLKSKGYALHIITNGFAEVQYIKLANSGLKGFFGEVIVSEEVGYKKPHIEVFSAALSSAGANKIESIVIGDDLEADIGGARNAGIDQVYYNPDQEAHDDQTTFEIIHLEEIHNIL
jgi:putative hydrolase of the HAD superfamily